jgi:hypothetical protein
MSKVRRVIQQQENWVGSPKSLLEPESLKRAVFNLPKAKLSLMYFS